jgi:hypothetical protein
MHCGAAEADGGTHRRIPGPSTFTAVRIRLCDSKRRFVRIVVALFFPPAQDSCLIQKSSLLRLCLVDLFPLRDGVLSGPIGVPAAHQSILQRSRRMPEYPLAFFALCADIKAYPGLINRPIHRKPSLPVSTFQSCKPRVTTMADPVRRSTTSRSTIGTHRRPSTIW